MLANSCGVTARIRKSWQLVDVNFRLSFSYPQTEFYPRLTRAAAVFVLIYVSYLLEARIKRSWRFDHTTEASIPFDLIVDINTRQLTVPLSSSSEKTLCCFCCASGPISLSITTDRGGYCPGESIAISAGTENHSNRRITCLRATLKQTVVYYAGESSITKSKVIQRVEDCGVSIWN